MTANEFRKLALDLPETVEAEHMNHPDFRIRGKIFATLAYPDQSFGMVKLSLPTSSNLRKPMPLHSHLCPDSGVNTAQHTCT